MKEPDYISMFITSYGILQRIGKYQVHRVENQTYRFRYPEIVYIHYAFRDSVDNHNSRRMHPITIEEVIKTTR